MLNLYAVLDAKTSPFMFATIMNEDTANRLLKIFESCNIKSFTYIPLGLDSVYYEFKREDLIYALKNPIKLNVKNKQNVNYKLMKKYNPFKAVLERERLL